MKRPKTALFAANRGYGLWSSRARLLELFVKNGWHVVAAAAEDDYARSIRAIGAEFHHVPFAQGGLAPVQDTCATVRLTNLYLKLRPHFVHHFNFKPIFFGGVAAHLTGTRNVVSTVTGTGYAFDNEVVAPLAMLAYRVGLAISARTVFQNPDDRDLFISKRLVKRPTTRLIVSSGVDTEAFRPSSKPPADPVFLMVTRLLWKKGVGEFVEAAARLKQAYPHVRFILGGEEVTGRGDSVPTDWLRELNDKGIEYIGYVNDMPSLLQSCSGFVLPSRYREGVPRVLLEAAATGLPLVTTDNPGCREVVRDGVNGFLVDVDDVDGLARAMERLIVNRGLSHEMGLAGRKLVESDFTLQHVINKTLAVYRSVGVDI